MATIIHTTYDDLDNKTLVANTEGEISVQTDASIGRTPEGALTVNAYSMGDSDARFVHKSGDTMTGNLTVSTADNGVIMLSESDDINNQIYMYNNSGGLGLYSKTSVAGEKGLITINKSSGAVSSSVLAMKGESYLKADADARFINTNETTTPVGGILPMATNTNPADIFPGTTWGYLAQDRYIMGGASGQATTTGGANSVPIYQGNLPSVNFVLNRPVYRGREEDGGGGVGWENGSEYMLSHSGGSGTWLTTTPQWTKFVFWKRNS